ncbi:hypothetical protein Tco_0599110 [Tanacetum coccineum]
MMVENHEAMVEVNVQIRVVDAKSCVASLSCLRHGDCEVVIVVVEVLEVQVSWGLEMSRDVDASMH